MTKFIEMTKNRGRTFLKVIIDLSGSAAGKARFIIIEHLYMSVLYENILANPYELRYLGFFLLIINWA